MSEQCPQSHLPVSQTRARTLLQRCLFISLMNSLWLNSRDIPIHRLIWGLTRVNSPVFFSASTPNLAEFARPQECTKSRTTDYAGKALSWFLFLPGSFCPALKSGSPPTQSTNRSPKTCFPSQQPNPAQLCTNEHRACLGSLFLLWQPRLLQVTLVVLQAPSHQTPCSKHSSWWQHGNQGTSSPCDYGLPDLCTGLFCSRVRKDVFAMGSPHWEAQEVCVAVPMWKCTNSYTCIYMVSKATDCFHWGSAHVSQTYLFLLML